jgi:hypothetical protein
LFWPKPWCGGLATISCFLILSFLQFLFAFF